MHNSAPSPKSHRGMPFSHHGSGPSRANGRSSLEGRQFREILRDPDFQKGDFDTGFIDRFIGAIYDRPDGHKRTLQRDRTFAAIAAAVFHSERPISAAEPEKQSDMFWKLDARRRGLRSS